MRHAYHCAPDSLIDGTECIGMHLDFVKSSAEGGKENEDAQRESQRWAQNRAVSQ